MKLASLALGCMAATIACAALAQTAAIEVEATATVDSRLKSVENKTKDFKIQRVRKVKTTKKIITSKKPNATAAASTLPDNAHSLVVVPIGEDFIYMTLWLDLTITYTANANYGLTFAPVLIDDDGNMRSGICQAGFSLQPAAASKTIKRTLVCRGVVHRAPEEALNILMYTPVPEVDATLSSVTLDARLVNEVLVKPEF